MRHLDNLEIGVSTHTGRVRRVNEDDFLVCAPQSVDELDQRGWFIAIADGMGGAAGGAEASRTAVRAAARPFTNGSTQEPVERMRRGFAEAVQEVYELSLENPHLRDMGTTLTVVNVLADKVVLGHVGDTRCLRARGGTIEQLSVDHAVRSPDNYLTRCIGAGQKQVQADVAEYEVNEGDRFILVSDGLWGVVAHDEILRVVQALPPQEAAEHLVRSANLAGGPDNITALVVHVTRAESTGELKEVELPAEEAHQPAFLREPERGLVPARWPWVVLLLGLVLMVVGIAKLFLRVDLVAQLLDLLD